MTTIDISDFKTLPIPFAHEGDREDINIPFGVVERFATRVEDGGDYISRKMFNQIGWLASSAAFLGSVGHIYGFNSSATYQKGAVVDCYDPINGFVRRLVCTADGSAAPVVEWDKIKGDGWKFADGIKMPPYDAFWQAVYSFVGTGESEDVIDKGEE